MNEPLLLKVGRALDNDVVLNIPFISDYHIELFQDVEGNVFMTDLKSSNGTFVNGQRLIGFLMLRAKDEVFLGSGFKLQWEQILAEPKFSKDKKVVNNVAHQKESVKYEDAYETVQPRVKQKLETNLKHQDSEKNKVANPVKENRDLAIIYGLIIFIILFWFLYQ
jgi:pSer/pThr/pTyr-binding forkhead associated (FHA) protein